VIETEKAYEHTVAQPVEVAEVLTQDNEEAAAVEAPPPVELEAVPVPLPTEEAAVVEAPPPVELEAAPTEEAGAEPEKAPTAQEEAAVEACEE
jgi:hypothetical protein